MLNGVQKGGVWVFRRVPWNCASFLRKKDDRPLRVFCGVVFGSFLI
ncbi:hypothetical protein Q5A_016435 [Serratia inhibens PRI-2C]|nr:hypothetical protein Q5A_016435 [Serratia inhibens PRI-2C]